LSLAAQQRHLYPDSVADSERRRHAFNGGAVAAGHEPAANTEKWCLLAAEALAMPGLMTLRAVREGRQVEDFVWDFASAAAARLLSRRASRLLGHCLCDVLGDPLGPKSVLDQYRRVVEDAAAEVDDHFHVINGVEDMFRHRAMRLGDGVAVTLINLSAVGRARALRQEMLRNGMARW
jgi:PAS fold